MGNGSQRTAPLAKTDAPRNVFTPVGIGWITMRTDIECPLANRFKACITGESKADRVHKI